MRGRERLDVVLVWRGFFPTRERAQRAVMAGWVWVDGERASKCGMPVRWDAELVVTGSERFVSRGGYKLEAALDVFGVDVAGRVCLDIGASTGGFTDCLLQRGAMRVYAVDVGRGQLDWRLRGDGRVVVREGVNARYLNRADFDEWMGVVVVDVSFISLTLILPAAFGLLDGEGDMIVLIKPQFELSAREVGRGGVVGEEGLRLTACRRIEEFVRGAGWHWLGCMESPVRGREGNVEYLAHLRR